MSRVAYAAFALAALASTQALADTHYMYCYGGGRAGLYYSANFPVPQGAKSGDTAKLFNAFVQKKYGTTIFSECHSDLTLANSQSARKLTEDSDQHSRFPSKLIETGWTGN
ncbi:MAG TPA: hypothetical protein VLT91_00520 [Rhizomicrobium sp.]|nr:hypothetical protein [Rhizomicrobium sp.]